jgi:hypothetical protein
MGKRVIAAFCVLVVFGGAVAAQKRANEARSANQGDEILFLPNRKLLNHFTGGMNNIVADLLWLRCIQYVGKESKGERNFIWLNQMLTTVVQLDPHFGDAYRYGGMFLAALKSDDDAGIALLEQGAIANPRNFQLPYELAMIFLLNRKDEPGSKERATYYLGMAASIDGCPEFIRELATELSGQYDLAEVELAMWQRMADSEDKLLRELAQRKLVEIDIRDVTERLNRAVLAFNQKAGRFPESLEELAGAGIMPVPGGDPLGGAFFLGKDGVIRNTTLLDETRKSRLKVLQNLLKSYKSKNGTWPAALTDLVDQGITAQLPEHPYPGETWRYDPTLETIN